MVNNKWGGKSYYTLNSFLREKFNEKVFKISLDGGFSCPNRDGTVAKGGCTYCSASGSGDFAGNRVQSISDQFDDIKDMMNKKWSNGKLIAYFQAYTNTYAPVDELRRKYKEAISKEGVVGLAIGTRPDCLPEDVLDLLEEMSKEVYVWVELGLQCVSDKTAERINRAYPLTTFEKGLKGLRDRGIDTVVHSIFGLPGESREDMLDTIKYLSNQDIQGIKIHLLHLMKNTKMAEEYEKEPFDFLTKEEYIDLVCEAVGYIREDIVIHRLTGDAPRQLLIGPMWSLKKWEILNAIDNTLRDRGIYQGMNFKEIEGFKYTKNRGEK